MLPPLPGKIVQGLRFDGHTGSGPRKSLPGRPSSESPGRVRDRRAPGPDPPGAVRTAPRTPDANPSTPSPGAARTRVATRRDDGNETPRPRAILALLENERPSALTSEPNDLRPVRTTGFARACLLNASRDRPTTPEPARGFRSRFSDSRSL